MKFSFEKYRSLAACALSLVTGTAMAQKQERPNFIFFIADDMTIDMFNCLSEGEKANYTPNLDKLANEGTLMVNQYVSATVSTPSRYGCLTGRYASTASNPDFLRQTKNNQGQRAVEWNTHIMPGEDNMASLLKKGGYTTGAVGKNHVFEVAKHKTVPLSADVSDPKVMKQQLDNYRNTIEAYQACGFDYADGIFYENPIFNGPKALAVHNLDWTTEAALKFLDRAKKTPFFLYFATTLPHAPHDAASSWNADRRITPIGILDKAPDVLPDKKTIPERLKSANIPFSNHKANLLWIDDALGALVEKLKANGQYDNTIILFFNDHGQSAKGTVYQGAVSNPSIVWRSKGFDVGKVCNSMVSNIDFLPTILDWAGVDNLPKSISGVSFAPALDGKMAESRVSLYFEIGYSRGVKKGNYKYIALRYPQWVKELTFADRVKILSDYNKKLAARGKAPNNTDPNAPFGHVQIVPGGGDAEFQAIRQYPHYQDADQLYDLSVDPKEQHNLAGNSEYQKVLEDMKNELIKYIQEIPGGFGELKK
ncbi:MAG: sulfatase family protein [Breznakibacter sp.]